MIIKMSDPVKKLMKKQNVALFAITLLCIFGAASIVAAVNFAKFEVESGTQSNTTDVTDAEAAGGHAIAFHAGTMGNQIPADQLPVGNPGSSQELIISGAPTGSPTPTSTSAFRIECGYSHMNYDDAIVYPGQSGLAHLHTYFGNVGANYLSTYQTLRNSGNSTCSGGILNRSAYWTPTMMNGGTPIAPIKIITYYKSGWPSIPYSTIQDIPSGLKMITGSATATSNQNTSGRTFIEWHCESTSGTTTPYIPTCNAGDEVVLIIGFPQCWDGVNLDSANHKSHMSMPQSYSGAGCPSTHPVPIPHIEFLVHWPVASGNSSGWRLSSDMYSTSSPGGYSAHADYMEGWDPSIRATFVEQCLVAGKDCQVRWLGDGRSLVNPPGVN